MSDFDGGLVLARADAQVAESVYVVVRNYLAKIGETTSGRTVVYTTGREVKALWLTIAGGPADGKGRTYWHEQNAALAGELAKALECEAWAWGREDQVGTESVVAFDASGKEISAKHVSWDDEDEDEDEAPIAALSTELGSWEASEGASAIEQALDEAFDPLLLHEYLLALNPPKPKSTAGRVKLSVFLTQNLLADATKLASNTATDLGAVYWAAWEVAKWEACRENPGATGIALWFPRGDSPAELVPPRKAAPALSKNDRSTPDLVTLLLPSRVEKEIRALAVHADVKYGLVVDYVYRLAREALWSGESLR